MIKIITDSSCDVDIHTLKKLGVDIIPIQVHFDDESYTPGIDLTNEKFYSKLEMAEKLPTTTQITPMTFHDEFSRHIEEGDEIVGLFISKELSGTYNNAVLTAKKFDETRIHIVDTQNTTFGLALLIFEAVKMREEGKTAKEIAERITSLVPRVELYAGINTLKFLKMGGRLSSAVAFVGGVLGICPIISVKEGKVVVVGKARGKSAVLTQIEALVKKSGVSADCCVTFGHSNVPESAKTMQKSLKEYTANNKVHRLEIGPVIGTHTGPGAYGVAFIRK